MQKFYKNIVTRKALIDTLLSVSDKFNVEATQQMNEKASRFRFHLVTKENKVLTADNFKKFMFFFGHYAEIKVYHKICFNKGHIFHIFTAEDVFGQGEEGAKGEVKPTVKVEVKVDKPKAVEAEAAKSIDDAVEETSEKEIDFSVYESLYNENKKRDSKNALELKVQEDFGIDLNKGKPFEEMIQELKDTLQQKQ